jgi:UDP:flavonoid glycosyltransferase YjiC (YdhE family)
MRIYVAISHHGLGHLAQTAPVLNALRELDPGIEFIVRTALPRERLEARLAMPFEYLPEPSDCNLVMRDAIRADVPASLAAYLEFHRDWPRRVEAEARRIEALRPDVVFSNVGYLPLAAANRVGLPAVAMCSLNWADIFRHYLGDQAGAAAILAQMHEAYAGARRFLRPEPSMPMADLGNAVAIPPVVQPGLNRRDELADRLDLNRGEKLVLVGMGGIRYRPPVERWPPVDGVVFLVPDDWRADHPAIRTLGETGMAFRDVLASSDALVTKPGYGSYVEAAHAGVPVLTIPRPDWPEAPYLNAWLDENVPMLAIVEERLLAGDLAEPLAALWRMPGKPAMQGQGAEVAARRLLELS